jgi:uncharacterized protein YhdP
MHPIARWLMFLANFFLVLVALVQVAGRLLMPALSSFEPQINALLAARQVSIEGLEGRWSLLNPVISATRVVLPAGEIRGIALQPDIFESALRSDIVFRKAAVDDGHVVLARDAEGWWLAGMERTGGSGFDLSGMLSESDELTADLTVTLLGSEQASIRASVRAINRGGRNSLSLQLTRPGIPGAKATLRVDRIRGLPLLRPPGHEGIVEVRDFDLPAPLLNQARIRLSRIQGAWMVADGDGRGQVVLDGAVIEASGSNPFEVSSALQVWSSGYDWGVSGDLGFSVGERKVSIRDVSAWQTDDRIEIRADHVDAGEVLGLAKEVARPVEKIDRWLTGLNAAGQVRDAWLFIRVGGEPSDPWRFGYGAKVLNGHTLAFNGVPAVDGADAEIIGYDRGFRISLDADDLEIGFPELFDKHWSASAASGSVDVFFRPGYSAVRGSGLQATTGSVVARGGFVVTNPELVTRKALVLLIESDGATLADAREFVPRTLGEQLRTWLTTAPESGQFGPIDFALQGQNKAQGIDYARRVEIRTTVDSLRLRYHPEWPELSGVGGRLAVRGNDVSFAATAARTASVVLDGSTVDVVERGGAVRIDLLSRGAAADYLGFVRGSPLRQRMAFVRPEWVLSGDMSLEGRLDVPLKDESEEARSAAATLKGELRNVGAELPELRLSFAELAGPFRFETPNAVGTESLTGRLWGEPVTILAEPSTDHVRLRAEGDMTVDTALMMAKLANPGFVSGRFSYAASVDVAVHPEAVTEIDVRSDLVGVDLGLPEGFGRKVEDSTPSTLGMQFLDEYVVLSFQYRDAQGWMHLTDSPLRGAVGVGADPPMIDSADGFVKVSGRLHHLHLEAWTRLFGKPGEEDVLNAQAISGPPAGIGTVVVDDLVIDRAFVGDLGFDDVILDADVGPAKSTFGFDAEKIGGQVVLVSGQPLDVNIERLRLPPPPKPPESSETREMMLKRLGPSPDEDPLPESLVAKLPPMDVRIARILRGEEDWGSWKFSLRKPAEQTAAISGLEAEIKGLRITSTGGVQWSAADDLTSFNGAITMSNLAEVLPQWRYAPSVASETAAFDASVSWSGSPLNIGIPGMVGTLGFSAKNGRFLEVEAGSGAMRIMSLFSFSAILKRLNFNFSDVIGKGVGFETLDARIELANGVLTFVEPMEVKSTSSDFRLGGSVNMHTGQLNNELVMTLPVSKNLPWYGVYIALANPLVGLGVIVGERVLRKPLEQFSSAKYEVRGTLAEPEVKFVELFDTELTVNAGVTQSAEGEAAVDVEPSEPEKDRAVVTGVSE